MKVGSVLNSWLHAKEKSDVQPLGVQDVRTRGTCEHQRHVVVGRPEDVEGENAVVPIVARAWADVAAVEFVAGGDGGKGGEA